MTPDLASACRAATYKLAGHGDRNFGVLMEAFAKADAATPADVYGVGEAINGFEAEMAALLGKPAAVFFPSGVMAQQIGLRIWCDAAGCPTVAYHPTCHLEIHEEDGLRQLHHLRPVLVGAPDRLISLDDLAGLPDPVAALLIELPQREIGGQLPSFDDLVRLVDAARARGMRVHLDGARLFETLPYYRVSAARICDLFDSVYVSFYKGFGSVAGAVLAGPVDFTAEAKVWKRRHGGDLISLYPYVVAARHHMSARIDKMGAYWQHAQAVAARFNLLPGVYTVPAVPVCNMFHVFFDVLPAVMEAVLEGVAKQLDVCVVAKILPHGETGCKAELSFGDAYEEIPAGLLDEVFDQLASELAAL